MRRRLFAIRDGTIGMSDPVATATRIRRGESIITDHRRKQHGFTMAGTRDMDGQGESPR